MAPGRPESRFPLAGRGRRIVQGVVANVLLFLLGLLSVLLATGGMDVARVLEGVDRRFLVLAGVAALVDLLIGAARYQIFLRHIRPGRNLWLALRADLASRFVGAVTPSQTGGGPAQVWILHRAGVRVGDALAFLTVNFLATLLFFAVTAGLAAWILQGRLAHAGVRTLVRLGFVVVAGGIAVMVLLLVKRSVLLRPVERWGIRWEYGAGRWRAAAGRGIASLLRCSDRYGETCSRLLRRHPGTIAMSVVLTGVLYLNKFTVGWLLVRGLGVDVGYAPAVGVQALLQLVTYASPTPGGSGLAEIGTGALMSLLMPGHLLAPFTLLLRVLLMYGPATVGAFILLRALRSPHPRAEERVCEPQATVLVCVAAGLLLAATPAPAAATQWLDLGARETPSSGDTVPESPPTAADVQAAVTLAVEARDAEVRRREAERAEGRARALLARAPASAEAHFLLATALGLALEHHGIRSRVRMAEEVRAEAEEALRLDPTHAGAHHVLGRLHAGAMRLGRIERFVASRLLGGDGLDGVSWERAEEHLRRAHELEPSSPRHLMELGALYIDRDRPEEAHSALDSAATLPALTPTDSLAVARARRLLVRLETERRGSG